MEHTENTTKSIIEQAIAHVKLETCNWFPAKTIEKEIINSEALASLVTFIKTEGQLISEDSFQRFIKIEKECLKQGKHSALTFNIAIPDENIPASQKKDFLLDSVLQGILIRVIARLNISLHADSFLQKNNKQLSHLESIESASIGKPVEAFIKKISNIELLKRKLITALKHPEFVQALSDCYQVYFTEQGPAYEKELQCIKERGVVQAMEANLLISLNPPLSAKQSDFILNVFYKLYDADFINKVEENLEKITKVLSKARLDQLLESTMPIDGREIDQATIEKNAVAFLQETQQLLETTVENRPTSSSNLTSRH